MMMAGRSVVVLLLVAALAVSCSADPIIDDEVMQGMTGAMIGASSLPRYCLDALPSPATPACAKSTTRVYLVRYTYLLSSLLSQQTNNSGQSIR
jgi:hypothetical protein